MILNGLQSWMVLGYSGNPSGLGFYWASSRNSIIHAGSVPIRSIRLYEWVTGVLIPVLVVFIVIVEIDPSVLVNGNHGYDP